MRTIDDLREQNSYDSWQKEQRAPTVAALRAEVRRKAAALAGVPRKQLADEFLHLMDDLRAEALARGVALGELPHPPIPDTAS